MNFLARSIAKNIYVHCSGIITIYPALGVCSQPMTWLSTSWFPVSPCHRRPSGVDTEFFLQLFLVPSEKKKWTVKEMLHKSLEEQEITFAGVCALHAPHLNKRIVGEANRC